MNMTREAEEDRVITNFVATKDIIRIEGREEPLYPLSFNELREFMRSISTPIDLDGLFDEWRREVKNDSIQAIYFKNWLKQKNIQSVTDSNQREIRYPEKWLISNSLEQARVNDVRNNTIDEMRKLNKSSQPVKGLTDSELGVYDQP